MAVPTVVGVTVGAVAQSSTMSVVRPAEATEGDLLVVLAYAEDDLTPPDESWELVRKEPHAGAGFAAEVWARPDDGDPGPWVFTIDNNWRDWFCIAVRNTSQVHKHSGGTGNGNTYTAPSLDTTADDCRLVFFAAANDELSGITPPAGMTEIGEEEATYLAVAGDVQATAGATGTRTATDASTRAWAALLLAFAPSTSDPVEVAAVLPAAGALGATAHRVRRGATDAPGIAALSAGASRARSSVATLAGSAGLTVSGRVVRSAGTTFAAAGTLEGTGRRTRTATASLMGSAAVAATGRRTTTARAPLAAEGTFAAAARRSRAATAALAAAGTLSVAGRRIRSGAADLAGAGALAATATSSTAPTAAVSLVAVSNLQASGRRMRRGSSSPTGAASLDATAHRRRFGAAPLTGASSLTASARGAFAGGSGFAGAASLTATPRRTRPGAATLAGAASVTARGTVRLEGDLAYLELADRPAAHLFVTDRLRWSVTVADRPATYLILEDR